MKETKQKEAGDRFINGKYDVDDVDLEDCISFGYREISRPVIEMTQRMLKVHQISAVFSIFLVTLIFLRLTLPQVETPYILLLISNTFIVFTISSHFIISLIAYSQGRNTQIHLNFLSALAVSDDNKAHIERSPINLKFRERFEYIYCRTVESLRFIQDSTLLLIISLATYFVLIFVGSNKSVIIGCSVMILVFNIQIILSLIIKVSMYDRDFIPQEVMENLNKLDYSLVEAGKQNQS